MGTNEADPLKYFNPLARWHAGTLARWEVRVRKAGATEWAVENDLENNTESILNAR